VSVATDGTTAWVLCDEATDKIRAYDVTNVAAELWNANAAASANSFIVYNPGNGYLYNYSGVTIRKVSASDGSVVWTSANLGSSVNSHRNWVGFGSDFVVIGVRTNSAANVFCLEDSDGSIRWSDYNGKAFDLAGSAWNMGSHGVCVSPSDRIFVSHGHKNQ
jgi:outer membrane protein assembly factor BamB